MRILLVDDEKLQLSRLEKAVKEALPEAEVLSFINPKEALEASQQTTIDIAFLDIEMPLMNGIQLGKKLKALNPIINIIIVTAYESYAIESYSLHASGYVLKPATKSKIIEEIANLRNPIPLFKSHKVQVKCFGNFEVFYNGKPLDFAYSKSKEVFAYLIDREGAAVSVNELNAVLWEEDHKSYLRNLIADIQATLRKVGAEGVFFKRYSECYIDVSMVDCDAYRYKKGDPNALNAYRGEYMAQYPWAFFEAE